MTDYPRLTDEQLASIRAYHERTTHPDWRDGTHVGQLLAEVARLRAELAQLRDRVLTEAAAELDRIADATEAKVAEHYGPASGIGPGSADMVREAARTVRSLAARATETVHACPPGDSSLTPCCGRTPFELSRTDRLTYDQNEINCRAARTDQ